MARLCLRNGEWMVWMACLDYQISPSRQQTKLVFFHADDILVVRSSVPLNEGIRICLHLEYCSITTAFVPLNHRRVTTCRARPATVGLPNQTSPVYSSSFMFICVCFHLRAGTLRLNKMSISR